MPIEPTNANQESETNTEKSVSELGHLTRHQLLERWRANISPEVPARLSNALMIKALAYDLQVRAFGGLSSQAKRALRQATNFKDACPLPRPGTRLLREWQGTLHEVEVLEMGYLWRGKSYRSLSAIAKAITGTKWSGPRFFGTGDKS
ncbi:MAG: DUF2924 domain-containing protein [Pseudomonadota bacterium]